MSPTSCGNAVWITKQGAFVFRVVSAAGILSGQTLVFFSELVYSVSSGETCTVIRNHKG
jgi:antitoxin (DNA-binding transcriptional repressor) of toxin-antitoxin stability system